MSTTISCAVRNESILLRLDSAEESGAGRNYEMWRARSYEEKEPDTLDWIDAFGALDPSEGQVVFYDIGANMGLYSLYAAKRWGDRISVLGFEPEALNFAKLNRNINANRLSGRIIPYCAAIGGRTGLSRFYANRFQPGAALHALGEPITQGAKRFEPGNEQGAVSFTLDDLVYVYGAPTPRYVKIDVDGIEAEIIDGAKRLLSDAGLESVLVEVYMDGNTAKRIIASFDAAGMTLTNTEPVDYTPGTVTNLIFRR
jgi:FkbM family methyltransferase